MAGVREAGRNVIPGVAGIGGGMASGALSGAAAGAFFPPIEPIAIPAGAIIGGIGAYIGARNVQDNLADEYLPTSFAGTQSAHQDATRHPIASTIGGILGGFSPEALGVGAAKSVAKAAIAPAVENAVVTAEKPSAMSVKLPGAADTTPPVTISSGETAPPPPVAPTPVEPAVPSPETPAIRPIKSRNRQKNVENPISQPPEAPSTPIVVEETPAATPIQKPPPATPEPATPVEEAPKKVVGYKVSSRREAATRKDGKPAKPKTVYDLHEQIVGPDGEVTQGAIISSGGGLQRTEKMRRTLEKASGIEKRGPAKGDGGFHEHPIIAAILENGGMMSKTEAIRSGAMKARGLEDQYSGVSGKMVSDPRHNVIFGGHYSPEQMADLLRNDPTTGVPHEYSPDDLWNFISNYSSRSRARRIQESKRDAHHAELEKQASKEETAADTKEWLPEKEHEIRREVEAETSKLKKSKDYETTGEWLLTIGDRKFKIFYDGSGSVSLPGWVESGLQAKGRNSPTHNSGQIGDNKTEAIKTLQDLVVKERVAKAVKDADSLAKKRAQLEKLVNSGKEDSPQAKKLRESLGESGVPREEDPF
jgi:hypothetical protein